MVEMDLLMTLTEFLLARLAEDEESVSLFGSPPRQTGLEDADPARVLADVEAKRRIVERCRWADESRSWENDYDMFDAGEQAFGTLLDLARPYADHLDFDPSWAAVN